MNYYEWYDVLAECDQETMICLSINKYHKKIVDLIIKRITFPTKDKTKLLKKLCQKKHLIHLNKLITIVHFWNFELDWDCGLYGACHGGHRDLAELMIAKGAINWDWGLGGACHGGHRDIVELMITKGAANWNEGLYGACRGGHRDMAELMIAKGATYCTWCHKNASDH